MIEACVEAGAVDGIVRSPKPTVDGLPLDVQAAIVELLRLAAASPRAPGDDRARSRIEYDGDAMSIAETYRADIPPLRSWPSGRAARFPGASPTTSAT